MSNKKPGFMQLPHAAPSPCNVDYISLWYSSYEEKRISLTMQVWTLAPKIKHRYWGSDVK